MANNSSTTPRHGYSFSSCGSRRAQRRKAAAAAPKLNGGIIQPQDIQAEMCLLGSVINGGRSTYDKVADLLSPEAFYEHKHAHIWAAIWNLATLNRDIDLLNVCAELKMMHNIDEAGGVNYLSHLTTVGAFPTHADLYAKIVAQKFKARQLLEYADTLDKEAFAENVDIETLISDAEDLLKANFRAAADGNAPSAGNGNITDAISDLEATLTAASSKLAALKAAISNKE